MPSTDLTISVSAYHQRKERGTKKVGEKRMNKTIAKRVKMWLFGQGKTCSEERKLFEIIICQVQM